MKTYKDLFSKICTEENFYKAYKNAIKGKSRYRDVQMIKRIGPRKYLRNLLEEVINKEYNVSKYEVFLRMTGHKVREIYKLPMRDRIVQHAIMNYLEPIFRETFILDTYSSIKGRGIHRALKRVKRCIRKYNYTYCLKLDIHKCYPSLDLDILKLKLARKFKDENLLWLLYTIIDSCDRGVPIGNYTSLYFNNFYFNDLDHWIKEIKRVKGYFRYCDDMVILSYDKSELHKTIEELKLQVEKLHVLIKKNWLIFRIEDRGVNFLGYIIRHDYTLIRKYTKLNFILKISKMDLDNLTYKDINVLGSYWGIIIHADCRNFWFKYTNVKDFKDLDIKVHDRNFVKNILHIPIVVTWSVTYPKKGMDWLKFKCTYFIDDEKGNSIEHKDVLISTSGEKLVEAGKLFNMSMYPFNTTIVLDDNGFYEFT